MPLTNKIVIQINIKNNGIPKLNICNNYLLKTKNKEDKKFINDINEAIIRNSATGIISHNIEFLKEQVNNFYSKTE